MKTLTRAFGLWLPLAAFATGAFAYAYFIGQQGYRQDLNDPQISMAEDGAVLLAKGGAPSVLVPREAAGSVDLRESLSPWVAVYDASGTPLAATGVLDGVLPKLPASLFDAGSWSARKSWIAPSGPETRVTWEPQGGVRQAVVLAAFDGPDGKGFVAAGRSMREAESRIAALTFAGALVWVTTLAASYLALVLVLALGIL